MLVRAADAHSNWEIVADENGIPFAVRKKDTTAPGPHTPKELAEWFVETFPSMSSTFTSRCRMIRPRPMSWLPKISMGLTLDQGARRLRCAECGGPLQSVKPWRMVDVLGKPIGRRG